MIAEGQTDARCSWDEEPGEFRWIFHRVDDLDVVELRILWFPELWGNASDADGQEVFRTTQSALHFGRSFSQQPNGADEHGEGGYAKEWVEHPFPTEALARLRRAIAASPNRS